jgi:hypothetical protein
MTTLREFRTPRIVTNEHELEQWNFYFNGGGFGRVSYRYVHVGSGVAFVS